MKISSFRRTDTLDGVEYAEILVVYFLIWKRVVPIYKARYDSHWRIEKSGSHCHGHTVERLAAKYDQELRESKRAS